MTFDQFKESLQHTTPPPLNVLLLSLWHDGKGDWNKAHDLVNDLEGKEAVWVHAYMHRKEGDQSNASYWYHRASKKISSATLEQEWEEIVRVLLNT